MTSDRYGTSPIGRYAAVVPCAIVTAFFFFPFYPTVAPWTNTKMLMALCGLIIAFADMAYNGRSRLDRSFLRLSLIALAVSLVSFASVVINSTTDLAYASYIISMWTWLAAAYFMVRVIDMFHGKATPGLICSYLIGVSICQCLIAVAAESIPAVREVIDGMMATEGFMGRTPGRLYGLGCALDVAGAKFAAVLILLAGIYPMLALGKNSVRIYFFFALAGCLIVCIGSVIGRTTVIGAIISLPLLCYGFIRQSGRASSGEELRKAARALAITFAGCLLTAVILFNRNADVRRDLRFGFEGFFSLVESGEWKVESNRQLAGQFEFPDNSMAWIIGEGYFHDAHYNPYYVGNLKPSPFYRATDVGYCRFIFYFGLTGLLLFIALFVQSARICADSFPRFRLMFAALLLLSLIYWVKVASDLFAVFAPFLALSMSPSYKRIRLPEN